MTREFIKEKKRIQYLLGNVIVTLWDAFAGAVCCSKEWPIRLSYCPKCGSPIEKRHVTLIEFGGDYLDMPHEPDTARAMQKASEIVEAFVGLEELTKPRNPPKTPDHHDHSDEAAPEQNKDALAKKMEELGFSGKAAQIFDELRGAKQTSRRHG